ncbi:MAG: hypothetical protein R3Y62_03410 [Eubacteriales bacterium]
MEIEITFAQTVCGTATVQPDGLYQIIRCDCKMVSGDLLRCYGIVGENIHCFGVLAPEGGRLKLEKRMSNRQWTDWKDCHFVASKEPPALESPWLPWQGRLYDRQVTNALAQTRDGVTEIALPYSMEEAFDYMEFFCMLTPKNIGGKMYLTCPLP